jgi:AraC-like DNA-binding protein
MRYAEYPPSAALAAIVDCYWILEGRGCGLPEPIIPDGRVEIVLHYGVRFERHHPDGRVERQDAAMIVGQMLAPICIAHRGAAGVAAIRLRPEATRAVIGYDAAAVTGSFVELEALFGSIGSLRDQLALAADDDVRVRLLETWLSPRVRRTPSREVSAAVAAIKAHSGLVNLAALASETGLSLRHLERRFLADVGITPKTFARLVRLQAALGRIASGEPLADVAHACGYYDQPHMTRDFSRLAEMSPAAWQRHIPATEPGTGGLTPLFVAR